MCEETVFSGVTLDEHMSWKRHILSVYRKISKSIAIIYQSTVCLPQTSLRSSYYSLVFSYLILCLLFQAIYIRITQEISAAFVYLIAELIFENFQCGFKVLTRLLVKFVLGQIYPLLSYILLLTFSLVNCKIKPNIMLRHNVIYVDTICLCGLHGWPQEPIISIVLREFLYKGACFPPSLHLAFTIQ